MGFGRAAVTSRFPLWYDAKHGSHLRKLYSYCLHQKLIASVNYCKKKSRDVCSYLTVSSFCPVKRKTKKNLPDKGGYNSSLLREAT